MIVKRELALFGEQVGLNLSRPFCSIEYFVSCVCTCITLHAIISGCAASAISYGAGRRKLHGVLLQVLLRGYVSRKITQRGDDIEMEAMSHSCATASNRRWKMAARSLAHPAILLNDFA